jgi:hypothetical protein
MVAHELHGTIAFIRMVFCWVSAPNTNAWHGVNQNAVSTAKSYEVQPFFSLNIASTLAV